MPLKLKTLETPLVTFRRVLPGWLGTGGECFIEIDGRAAGSVNTAYAAGMEQVTFAGKVADRVANRLPGDAEFLRASEANLTARGNGIIGVVYDTCVIAWRTNIVDANDKPLTCDRETFLELFAAKVPPVAAALGAFYDETLKAGADVWAVGADTLKN